MRDRNFIPRNMYYNQIEPFIGKGMIKVLTGQRRVGKSFILFQLLNDIKNHDPGSEIIYIDKEDYQFDAIKTHVDLMNYLQTERKSNRKCYLFIDEIQDIENFEIALGYFLYWKQCKIAFRRIGNLFGRTLCANSYLFIDL
jgi:predicted AAA+ superfamily ATPase